MAVTAFGNAIHTAMNNIQADLLAKNPTIDDDVASLEDCQLLTIAYVLVKAIRARERYLAGTRDRVFGKWVGGYAAFAFNRLISMIEPVYQEMRAAANDVDTPDTDDPWDTNYLTKGTGTTTGPMG